QGGGARVAYGKWHPFLSKIDIADGAEQHVIGTGVIALLDAADDVVDLLSRRTHIWPCLYQPDTAALEQRALEVGCVRAQFAALDIGVDAFDFGVVAFRLC